MAWSLNPNAILKQKTLIIAEPELEPEGSLLDQASQVFSPPVQDRVARGALAYTVIVHLHSVVDFSMAVDSFRSFAPSSDDSGFGGLPDSDSGDSNPHRHVFPTNSGAPKPKEASLLADRQSLGMGTPPPRPKEASQLAEKSVLNPSAWSFSPVSCGRQASGQIPKAACLSGLLPSCRQVGSQTDFEELCGDPSSSSSPARPLRSSLVLSALDCGAKAVAPACPLQAGLTQDTLTPPVLLPQEFLTLPALPWMKVHSLN